MYVCHAPQSDKVFLHSLNSNIMATKLVPTDAGIPGKQLDIFDEAVNQQEDNRVYRQPAQPIPPVLPIPTPVVQHPQIPKNQKGTFQSFRL